MENIKKSTKKLKEYFIPNMIETLVSLQNNINIKKKLSDSIMNFTDEKMIIYYIKIISEDKSLLTKNSNILLSNYFKTINTYETNLEKIKNEISTVQKILIENKLEEIKDLFENNEIKKDKMGNYLNLIELNDKYSKLLKINWELLDFKDYFKNPDKLLNAIIIINDNLTQF